MSAVDSEIMVWFVHHRMDFQFTIYNLQFTIYNLHRYTRNNTQIAGPILPGQPLLALNNIPVVQ